MSVFSFDEGTSTFAWRVAMALRMRVSMSAIGSDVVIPCRPPASGLQPYQLALITPSVRGFPRRHSGVQLDERSVRQCPKSFSRFRPGEDDVGTKRRVAHLDACFRHFLRQPIEHRLGSRKYRSEE